MTNHAYCLGLSGLAVFAATADQRYLLGSDVFMRTHFPITLRRFRDGRDPELVSEDKLLARLLAPVSASQGNRVFVLYGAAGSGKSELMRWVQTRLEQEAPDRAEVTMRVSRTELDVLTISEKFRRLLGKGYFDEATHRRWQMARQKPRTLTKLVVLCALENVLDDDEIINALFYRLTNAIQPHMAHCLGVSDIPGAVDILSQETWEEVVSETVLPVPVDYEMLRHQMLVALQSHLLEGFHLPSTLRLISDHVVSVHQIRPLLLVDDMVQSLNLFATDLLDYFVTLESGQWDVILGMTPAALETTKRGRELLERIAYLDTLDDRVTKLWLSDDVGTESYFLGEGNCHHFAARYLAEHRRLNAAAKPDPYEVGSCLVIDGDGSLCPFSHELLVRMFRRLPAGKGKARYFLNALHEVLERTGNGTPLLMALDGVTKPDGAVRCEDPLLARIGEFYGPFVGDQGLITLGAGLVRFFGLGDTPITLDVEPLTRRRIVRSAVTEVVDDEEKAAIRDWLQGRPVNRQLLKGLRRGAARWLRAVAAPDLLYRHGVAKPFGVLRWRKTYLDTCPPICLEEVDDGVEGVPLQRGIGPVAFDLHRYAITKGAEAKQLLAQLSAEYRLLPLLFAAEDARQRAIACLEAQVGMAIEDFALRLCMFFGEVGSPPSDLLRHTLEELTKESYSILSLPFNTSRFLNADSGQAISRLFSDWFKLRNNAWDGPEIVSLVGGQSTEALRASLTQVDASNVDRDYRLGGIPVGDVLLHVQQVLHAGPQGRSRNDLSTEARVLLETLVAAGAQGLPFQTASLETWAELQDCYPDLYVTMRRTRI